LGINFGFSLSLSEAYAFEPEKGSLYGLTFCSRWGVYIHERWWRATVSGLRTQRSRARFLPYRPLRLMFQNYPIVLEGWAHCVTIWRKNGMVLAEEKRSA